jgi:hypothetical protein
MSTLLHTYCFLLHVVTHCYTLYSTVVPNLSEPFSGSAEYEDSFYDANLNHDPDESVEAGESFDSEAQHLHPGKRDLISILLDLFSSNALWTDGAIIHAISSLPPSDFVAPAPVPWSDSVARNLIPVEAYSEYSESERRFIQLAAIRDWTQSETHDVLKVLKDVRFRLEDIRPDLL